MDGKSRGSDDANEGSFTRSNERWNIPGSRFYIYCSGRKSEPANRGDGRFNSWTFGKWINTIQKGKTGTGKCNRFC